MSRTMLVDTQIDADEEGFATLFDVKRVDSRPAPISYLQPRSVEYISSSTMAAAEVGLAQAVSDGGLEPVFED